MGGAGGMKSSISVGIALILETENINQYQTEIRLDLVLVCSMQKVNHSLNCAVSLNFAVTEDYHLKSLIFTLFTIIYQIQTNLLEPVSHEPALNTPVPHVTEEIIRVGRRLTQGNIRLHSSQQIHHIVRTVQVSPALSSQQRHGPAPMSLRNSPDDHT